MAFSFQHSRLGYQRQRAHTLSTCSSHKLYRTVKQRQFYHWKQRKTKWLSVSIQCTSCYVKVSTSLARLALKKTCGRTQSGEIRQPLFHDKDLCLQFIILMTDVQNILSLMQDTLRSFSRRDLTFRHGTGYNTGNCEQQGFRVILSFLCLRAIWQIRRQFTEYWGTKPI